MDSELITEIILKIFFDLAVILFFTKFCGLIAKKIGLPQVVGMVVAGLLIGPALTGLLFNGFGIIKPLDQDVITLTDGKTISIEFTILKAFSQIGVLMILFSSGLETHIVDLKKSGLKATVLAFVGVVVPLIMGFLLAAIFLGGFDAINNDRALFMNAVLIGTIMTATSVGITVETLRELGKLNGEIGTVIVSAAVIDDVLGIIVLSIVTSINSGGDVFTTIIKAVLFFIVAIAFGFITREIFKFIAKDHHHSRREGIFALSMCFLYGFAAEKFFGIASITGAYIEGVMLSDLIDTGYVNKKVLQLGYMIFSPIFFAYIGISADFSNFKLSTLLFGLLFVIVAIVGKLIAGIITGKIFKHSFKESLELGSGMVARGEVALAVYGTGAGMIATNGIDPIIGVIMLILISSVVCPVMLKILMKDDAKPDTEVTKNTTEETTSGNTEN